MRVCTIILLLALAAQAQTTQQSRTGLDTLHDDRLISELAARGLGDLLERAFEVNNVPEEKRAGIRTMAALSQLRREDIKLSGAQRRQLLADIARNIDQTLPLLNEPQTLMQQAQLLIRHGIERDVNTLEYWGENPSLGESLRPVAAATIKLLARTEELARKEADELGNQLAGPSDPRSRVWEDLTALANNAVYTRHMVLYALALSYPPASDERYDTAAGAIEYLKQFDNPTSTIQPTVRARIAKLAMLRGSFDMAQELWATLIAPAPEMQPQPDANQQFEARYFSAVCEMLSQKLPEARAKLEALVRWRGSNPPTDAKAKDAEDAAISILQYRLALAANDPAQARQVLLALLKRRPDLRSIIFDQLLAKLPASEADVKSLDPLLLQAIIQRADSQRLSEKPEPAALRQGIAAARQLLTFRGRADIDVETIGAAALLVPLFEEKLGHEIEAVNGFLDYLRDFDAKGRNGAIAIDAAQTVLARLRSDPKQAEDPAVVAAYERFLPVAIGEPFKRQELAFEYGRLLQSNGKYKEAAEQFAQVASTDPRLTSARFYQMVCTRQRLDDPQLTASERGAIAKTFAMLSDQVAALAESALRSAKTDADKVRYRSILVRSMLLAADVARREQNNPERTLTLLENIETAAAGLDNEKELLASALYTRVQAYMSLGQNDLATTSLVKLLQTRSGGEGASIVHDLMQRLNGELDQAQQANDRKRMMQIAANRATLSGFLVEWSKNNPDQNIRRYAHRYAIFDAAAKRLAADLIEDPNERLKALQGTLALYRSLENAKPPTTAPAAEETDPQVALGIGLIAYDLGDYSEAQRRLGQLLIDRKLGSPTVVVTENGAQRPVENDAYWEATLKLLRSNLELWKTSRTDPAAVAGLEQSRTHLNQLYIQWGEKVGGAKWHGEFEKLRAELMTAAH